MAFKNRFEKMFNFFVNLFLNIFNRISYNDIELIKKSYLFTYINPKNFNKIISAARLSKYYQGQIIFKEGDLPEYLYVIASGAVRVFTYDVQGKKIALARLSRGDFFGEQALLGESGKTRNANTEAIEDSIIIKINSKLVIKLLQEDRHLKTKLKKLGYAQAIKILSESIKQFDFLTPLASELSIGKFDLLEISPGKIIFNLGDQPGFVYFILQGEVELIFAEQKGHIIPNLTLHKGHLFGELSVLENKPRQATALAHTNVRLLAIEGEKFKKLHELSPSLQQMLTKLQHTYQLPLGGVAEQYVGNAESLGPITTNIYKMEDGRSIISIFAWQENAFTMSKVNNKSIKTHKYISSTKQVIEIGLEHEHLVLIRAHAQWPELSLACQALLNNQKLNAAQLEQFTKTGQLKINIAQIELDPIICTCMAVSKSTIQEAIINGCNDLNAISNKTGACTVCRGCRYKILELLGENPWYEAIMEELTIHHAHIRSYLITLKKVANQIVPFQPGQYLILQANINGKWVERAYTISDVETAENTFRVTIKRMPNGLFSGWLFENAPKKIAIKVTKPQGEFVLNSGSDTPAICFAGGIGITPFLPYAKILKEINPAKKLHIIYLARKKEDFIFNQEFNEILANNPALSIEYWEDEEQGIISAKDVFQILNKFNQPEIYICGSEQFNQLIYSALDSKHYPKNKIFIEKFVHAGS